MRAYRWIRGKAGVLAVTALALGAGAGSALGQATQSEGGEMASPELRQLNAANGFLERGLYEQAAKEYRGFLEGHEKDAQAAVARYGLGVSLYRMHQYEEAGTELEKVYKLAGFTYATDATMLLAQCRFARNDFDKAAETAELILKGDVNHALADDAAALWVESKYRMGKYAEIGDTAGMFESKWGTSPLRTRTELFASMSLIAQGKDEEAVKALAAMREREANGALALRASLLEAQCLHRLKRLPEAGALYTQVLEGKEEELKGDATYGLASVMLAENKSAESAKLFDAYISGYPKAAMLADAVLSRARLHYEAGEYADAAGKFSQYAELAAEHGDVAQYWLAKCELRQNKPADAAARLKNAIENYPKSELAASMKYDRGIALSRANDPAAAGELAAFVEAYPDHELTPDALHLAAMLEYQGQHAEKSLELCRSFLRRFEKNELAADVRFVMGQDLVAMGKIEEASDAFKDFLEKHGNDERAATARFQRASALYSLKKMEEARPLLEQTVQMPSMPKDMAAAWLMIGEIDFAGGKWAEAQRELEQYLKSAEQPISPDSVLVKMAIAQQKQDLIKEAIGTYGRVMEEYPKSQYWAQATFEHGQLQLQSKDAEGARASFAKLVDNAPDSTYVPHALCHLAAGAIEEGKTAEAVEMYRRAAAMTKDAELHAQATYNLGMALLSLKKYDEAAKALAEYLKAHPDRPEGATARAQLAIALARTDQCDDALTQMNLVLADGGSSLDGQLVSSVLYEQAWCLKKGEHAEDAAQAYRTLLKRADVDPNLRSHALLELAEIDAAAKRQDVAVESLKSVLANETGLTPDVKEQALYRLGMSLRETGKTAEASEAFGKFVAEFGKSELATSARFAAAEGYFSLNQPVKAIEFLKPLAEANVDKQWRAPALLRLGECAAQVQDWGVSRSAYDAYLKAYPDSDLWFHARFGLGWALENTDQYDQAIEQYKTVTDKHQGATAARAQFQTGECLFAQKKLDDALREFLKVDILYSVPEWAAAGLYEAGRCLEEMKKPAEAKAQYDILVKKYPETKWAKMVNGSAGSGGSGAAGQN